MASIGFLTPYKHLPDFKDYVESNFKCLNLSKIKKEECSKFWVILFRRWCLDYSGPQKKK